MTYADAGPKTNLVGTTPNAMTRFGSCILLILLTGCSLHSAAPKVTSNYVFERQKTGTVFIFVHGIFGDSHETWTAKDKRRYFDFMKKDDTFKDADFYVYGFPSDQSSESFTIDQAAIDLHKQLQDSGVLDYKKIIFICHSMGGLVVERFLLSHKELSIKVPLIFLYSTPQEGSAVARIGRYVSSNRALDTLIAGDKNRYLVRLDGVWKQARSEDKISTAVRCAYETQPTPLTISGWHFPVWMFGMTVVDYYSGTRFCEGESAPIASDHINIVKPRSASDKSYLAFKEAYQIVVLEMPPKGPGEFLDKAASNRQINFSLEKKQSILRRAAAIESSIRGARVLWVDDEPGNNDAERNALAEFGIRKVDIAISTDDALERIEDLHWHERTYDIVISDMRRGLFQPWAGLDLLRKMREQHDNTKVIFYTWGRGEEAKIGDAFGITTRPDELFDMILDALEGQKTK